MSPKESKTTEPSPAELAAVTGFAPGGPLTEHAAYLRANGHETVVGQGGLHIWVSSGRRFLERVPIEKYDEPDPAEVRGLLRRPGIWAATWVRAPDADHPPNAFHYVCAIKDYRIDGLPRHARADVRYGLRNYTVRLSTPEELAGKGFAADADTAERHGVDRPTPEGLRCYAESIRGSRLFDIWGAWKGDDLTAWMTVARFDAFAALCMVRSRSGAKGSPNNALLYVATRQYLVEDGLPYVTAGLSTIKADTNALNLHEYKIRMGYEARPVFRRFAVHPLLAPVLKTRAGSWLLEKAAGTSSVLQRASGLARLMSGREKSPLAWAQPERRPEEHREGGARTGSRGGTGVPPVAP
jgi:hypothetical protein